MAAVATPNIPEAEVLSGICIRSSEDMVRAAEIISREYGCAVLCKGGHRLNDANDLLYRDGGFCWFMGRRIDNPNTHGTGCTLSSAIASGLARGLESGIAADHIISMRYTSEDFDDGMTDKDMYNGIKRQMTNEGRYYLCWMKYRKSKAGEKAVNSLLENANTDIYVTGSIPN